MNFKKSLFTLFAAIAVYVLLFLHHGYELGRSDHAQAAYGFYLNNNSLYANDFYIQSLAHQTPNERTFYGYFISLAGKNLSFLSFVFHFLFSIMLLLGVRKIASKFIQSEWVRWLAIMALFIGFYNIHIGSNELYYNSFIPSLPAKAIGVWGLWLFIKKKYFLASLLFSCSLLFQPLVGIQLLVVSSLVILLTSVKSDKKIIFKNLMLLILPSTVISLPFIIPAITKYNEVYVPGKYIFDVFFSFRNPHHFIPSYFPLRNYMILIPLFGVALLYYKNKISEIMYFVFVVLMGCIVYSFFVEILHNQTVASTQWFKSTIWVEMLGVIALFAILEKAVKQIIEARIFKWKRLINAGIVIFVIIVISLFPYKLPWKVKYDFEPYLSTDAAVEISRIAKNKTPVNACFVVPIDFTELKFHGQRSTYVDYKLPVHSKAGIVEWMQRVTCVYKIDYRGKLRGFDVTRQANENYNDLTEQSFIALKKFGVTHVLTHISQKLSFERVGENSEYVIYLIP
ncbi:MAG: hypothetical protein HY951_11105 [Bacteroidia bacterium]|nr:hypothetical protein [Bacteroidia bacterium]